MGKLEGKTAIVTGATSGMGKGIAELFAAEGAAIIAGGRDPDRGDNLVKSIAEQGGKAVFIRSDISSVDGNQSLVDAALQQFGRIDVLVPNAGILGIGSLLDTPVETWQKTLDVNLNSVYYLIKQAVPHMMEKGGTIVVNGSIACFKAFPNHPAYCASKGALLQLVRQLALDLAPKIRINILCPGQVDTPLLWDSAAAFPDPASAVSDAVKAIPLQRLGTPVDIAKAALFLAGDDSSWITGTSLVIDGGLLVR